MGYVDDARVRRDGGDNTAHHPSVVIAIAEVGQKRDRRGQPAQRFLAARSRGHQAFFVLVRDFEIATASSSRTAAANSGNITSWCPVSMIRRPPFSVGRSTTLLRGR